MDEDHGDAPAFSRLDEGHRFEQLVEGAESAGHDDVGRGELDEHVLAREEVAERLRDVLVGVGVLLVRQLDVEPHRRALAEVGAFVGRFHHAGAAAGDDGEAGVRQFARDALGEQVIRMVGDDAGAAEDAHRRPDGGQPLGALDEFGHDAEDAPGFASVVLDVLGVDDGVGEFVVQRHGLPFIVRRTAV